ncbi:MAG: sugar ABC transporter permease [Chloroflexi bacterium]|nr:sugar ABC transporter permease [Chloroflexota bacterium]
MSTAIPSRSVNSIAIAGARKGTRRDSLTRASFVLPAVLIILLLSIFPLLISLFVSVTRLQFVPGGFELLFVGFNNYYKLLFGIDQGRFLGKFGTPDALGWLVLGVIALGLVYWVGRAVRRGRVTVVGLVGRIVLAVFLMSIALLTVSTMSAGGRPGTLWVTLFYVYVGISIQYLLGLGLAYLCAQHIPGRRFFRVIFLLPMMITPVGVAYMFRMVVDTNKGPFYPVWAALGMENVSWVSNPWSARAAILVSDIWQWTPFMFIVLLAALESLPVEPLEAAVVDGATRWQIFRHITLPALLPVSTTLILIRMVEAFKIIDLPNIMTAGGPGTATESMTLEGFYIWRALDIGGSAAIAYLLLFIVTLLATAYANLVRNQVAVQY